MNNIERLIEDFAEGRLDVFAFQTQLNNDMQSLNRNQDAKQERLIRKISRDYCTMRSPEEIICEEERIQDIINILQRIKDNIPEELWWIMVQIVVKKKTQTELAEILQVNRSTVCRRVKKAVGLASRMITIKEYNECFRCQ